MFRVRFSVRCLVCVLVLATFSALPPAAAAQSGPAEVVSGAFTGLWSWLAEIWTQGGCILDPNGRCAPEAPASSEIDGGCHIDPDGRCAPEAPASNQIDAGCIIDPNGGCRD